MIRIAIVSDTETHAAALAERLRHIEGVELVAILSRPTIGSPTGADVVVADRLEAEDLPEGPPVVLISDNAALERPGFRDVRACLTPDATPAELHAAILSAAQDLTVFTAIQLKRWLTSMPDMEEPAVETFVEALTARELQVLRLLADGLGNKEIAARLGISEHTSKFHVAQILAKLGAGSRAEAVAIGIRRGLLPI